jgi:hypothetical protein
MPFTAATELLPSSRLNDQESRVLQTFDFGIDLRNDFESIHLLKISNLQVELPLCARAPPRGEIVGTGESQLEGFVPKEQGAPAGRTDRTRLGLIRELQ